MFGKVVIHVAAELSMKVVLCTFLFDLLAKLSF